MIKDKNDLKEYLEADYSVIQVLGKRSACWKYLKVLRKTEYYENTGRKIRAKIYHHILNKMQVYTGVSIKPNNFGKGLGLFHTGSIVVNSTARFGDWCVIQNNVNVAADVVGGGYIYLAPGCCVNERLKIADHVIIGSNAVLTKNVEEPGVTWAGVPAKKISGKGFYRD